MSVKWLEDARELLRRRDRYTREDIRQEFESDPEHDAIAVDLDSNTWVTAVADRRYSVVWQKANEDVVVVAVVPTQFSDGDNLKKQVEAVVSAELATINH